jgi:hypothetical protein
MIQARHVRRAHSQSQLTTGDLAARKLSRRRQEQEGYARQFVGLAGGEDRALRRVLRDEAVVPTDQQALTLVRSLPHGHAVCIGWAFGLPPLEPCC